MSNPQTTIYLCKGVRLTNDYIHTIWFGSQTEQLNYFSSKVSKTLTNYTYVRKSWSLKVDATMETARTWNYLYFRNGSGKYYFYFINNIEYINEHTVELFIEMDVMQTYLTDYTLSKCFVEREHSATDNIGDNVIDEGLEVGELVDLARSDVSGLSNLCILIMSSIDPEKSTEETPFKMVGTLYDNIFSGLGIWGCEISDFESVAEALNDLDSWGYSDGVFNIWVYPKNLVKLRPGYEWGSGSKIKMVLSTEPLSFSTARNTKLKDSYIPKNNKLFCYPYNFLYVSNNGGGSATFKYEYFSDPSSIDFKVYGSLSPEGATKIAPSNYHRTALKNFEEGLSGVPYPCCAWNQDAYKLWLAQNQSSQTVGLIASGASIVGGAVMIATGAGAVAGAGMIAGGALGIANQLAQKKDMEVQPPQAKGSHSGSLNIANGFQTFTFTKKCVDTPRARIIDDYFSMFGYKTLRVKVPNRNVRESYTYTKTQNCHVSGNLCTDDLRKIQSIYDNGITFWKDGDKIGDYGVSNNCI